MGCVVRNQGLAKPKTVRIPFWRQFKEPMLRGQKTWTSRTKKYGKVGDIFEAFGSTFELKEVTQMLLSKVAINHFVEEGFESFLDFVDCWEKLHYLKGYVPEQKVWVHVFEKLEASA